SGTTSAVGILLRPVDVAQRGAVIKKQVKKIQ
ncbi:hypothetical protein LCGC14_2590860, partial [marine sediment metagenome]